jgi:long-chain fatty acid transport protein
MKTTVNPAARPFSKVLFLATITPTLMTMSELAYSSAFQIWEQSAVSAGVAHADMAAGADDASTAYYNPAGMTRIEEPTVSAGAMWVAEETSITNMTFTNLAGGGTTESIPNTSSQFDGVAPNFYMVYPLDDLPFDPVVGLAANGPYGASTYYEKDAFVANYATKSSIKAILINPSLALKLTEKLSFGAGMDIQELSSNYKADISKLGTSGDAELSDWALGWNAGLLYEFTEATRVGATYRSEMHYDQDGPIYLSFLGQSLGGKAYSEITLPAMSSLGLYHDVNKYWSLMATAAYVQWNSIDHISVFAPVLDELLELGLPDTFTVDTNFENSWFFAVGTAYKPADKWIVRAGVYYDQTPTNDEDRELRLPDSDRYAFTLGAGYQLTPRIDIDLAYQFIYTPTVDVTSPAIAGFPESFGFTSADAKSHANLWGVQASYNF